VSFWGKATSAGNYGNFLLADGPSGYLVFEPGGYSSVTTEFTRFTYTFVVPSTGTYNFATYLYGDGQVVWLSGFQLENKSHATQYLPSNGAATTRSSTQGLKDLMVTNQIDLSNVSFDANAQIIFDGTNDRITGGASTNYLPLPTHSLEAWIKSPGLGAGMGTSAIFGITYGLIVQIGPSGTLTYYAYTTDSGSQVLLFAIESTGTNLFDNKWHHVVCTRDSSNVNIYIDGILNVTAGNGGTWTGTNVWASMDMLIGNNPNNIYYYFNGSIDIAKIYNRGLTAQEVTQNYNAIKTRFNLA
jgi:hypothetical protein